MVLQVGACGAVSDAEVKCDGAVASGGVGECMSGSVVGGCICGTINPGIIVAMVLQVGACGAVSDDEVECDGAIASGGVGERVSSSAVIVGIRVSVNPRVAVAMVLRVGAYSAVVNGEVESDGAVTSRGIGKCMGGSAVIGGISVAINPGVAVAMILSICSCCAVIDGEKQSVGTVNIGSRCCIKCSMPDVAVTCCDVGGGTVVDSQIQRGDGVASDSVSAGESGC